MGEWHKTGCVLCAQNCGLEALVEENRMVTCRGVSSWRPPSSITSIPRRRYTPTTTPGWMKNNASPAKRAWTGATWRPSR